jgi:high-affinity iron transporter
VGAVLGLVCAVVVGYLIYKRAVTLNLAIFFRVTGIALIVIASGVLAYGVSDLQEANLLPGASSIAFDLSNHISPDGFVGTMLKGTVSLSPTTTWLQLIVHLVYLVLVMLMFLRPVPRMVVIAATDPTIDPPVNMPSVTSNDSVAL